MKFRAIIFDLYNTLLEIVPPPGDAGARWVDLCHRKLGMATPPTLEQFEESCRLVVHAEHALAHSRGVRTPEVVWGEVARLALPALGALKDSELADFVYEHAGLERGVRLMAGAEEVLRHARAHNVTLGILSNAQAYSVRELERALGEAGLSLDLFDRELCFWSYRFGFSKPDPYAFQILNARLLARGVRPEQILMVGDREDNDILPARSFSWIAWHLRRDKALPESAAGDWAALRAYLREALTPRL